MFSYNKLQMHSSYVVCSVLSCCSNNSEFKGLPDLYITIRTCGFHYNAVISCSNIHLCPWANTYNKFDPASPFGGYKESGFGREGGLQGLASYVDIQ